MQPKVSVIMTAYNAAAYVRDAIDSILSQTFTDFEFIVIDDHSGDETPEIVRSYTDPRIRFIRNAENLGISRTRNLGIETARGDYLAALDHDDMSAPTRLERQAAFLDAHPNVVLLGTGSRLLEHGRITDYYPVISEDHLLRWALLTRCPLIHSSICMRRRTLVENGIVYRAEYPCAEDFDLYHQLSRVGELACLPERLTIYREHGGNASTVRAQLMNERGQAFLLDVHRELLGSEVTRADVELIWKVMTCRGTADSVHELRHIGELLSRLLDAFLARRPLGAEKARQVTLAASRDWWQAVARSARKLGFGALRCYREAPRLTLYEPSLAENCRSFLGVTRHLLARAVPANRI